jgi:energy-coupling factor transport system permease protein
MNGVNRLSQFLKSFSTVSILVYISVLLAVVALCQNPAYQVVIFISLILIMFFIDKKAARTSVVLALFIGVPVLIINPLVNQSGSTFLLRIIDVPVFNRIDITLESIVFALYLMFKLINTVLTFYIFNLLIHQDKLLSLVSHTVGKSALIITITTKLIPSLSKQLNEITDIQKTRGAVLDSKNPIKRVKAWYPFSKIILFSGLENSYGISEAIQSKGYGTGRRAVFYNEKTRPRDLMLITNSAFLIIFIFISYFNGLIKYSFFPKMDSLITSVNQALVGVFITILIVFPVILYEMRLRFYKKTF